MEKIDIILDEILVYDIEGKMIKNCKLSDFNKLDTSYIGNCKLFTINITNPCKRVIKFYETNSEKLEQKKIFDEFIYEDMTEQQKTDFDNFVALINSI